MPSVRTDALTDADTAGKPAFPPHPLRIRGRTFRRSVGTLPPLPAGDETSSERGVTPKQRVCRRVQLGSQEPFVCIAGVTEAVADASDLF